MPLYHSELDIIINEDYMLHELLAQSHELPNYIYSEGII